MSTRPAARAHRPACPTWVLDQLYGQGLPGIGHDQTTFTTTGRATPYWHGACGQPVITGTAWPRDVLLDPTPTTVDGELFALLAGRATVQLYGRDLWLRHSRDIALCNADDVIVLIEHSCTGPPAIPNDRHAPKKRPAHDLPPF